MPAPMIKLMVTATRSHRRRERSREGCGGLATSEALLLDHACAQHHPIAVVVELERVGEDVPHPTRICRGAGRQRYAAPLAGRPWCCNLSAGACRRCRRTGAPAWPIG